MIAKLAIVGVLAVTALGCHRGPLPSTDIETCASTCESLACFDPAVDAEASDRCESYCKAKFEASSEQGAVCERVFADAMTCLGELSCEAYTAWLLEAEDAPCPNGRSQVENACEGIYLEPYILPP